MFRCYVLPMNIAINRKCFPKGSCYERESRYSVLDFIIMPNLFGSRGYPTILQTRNKDSIVCGERASERASDRERLDTSSSLKARLDTNSSCNASGSSCDSVLWLRACAPMAFKKLVPWESVTDFGTFRRSCFCWSFVGAPNAFVFQNLWTAIIF